jgi:mono/diheme cytochrome c family protein
MNVWNVKIVTLILTVGLLSACGSGSAINATSTATSASQPTEAVASPTQASNNPPTATQVITATTISFAKDIQPLLGSRCVSCHGGDRTEKGLSLKSYDDLMKGSENGTVVTAGNADQSKLAQMVINQKMPKRGPKLTPPQIQLIVDWINQGALNN